MTPDDDRETVRAEAAAQWVPRDQYTPAMWEALHELVDDAHTLGLIPDDGVEAQ